MAKASHSTGTFLKSMSGAKAGWTIYFSVFEGGTDEWLLP
jgi:hypothetical protein